MSRFQSLLPFVFWCVVVVFFVERYDARIATVEKEMKRRNFLLSLCASVLALLPEFGSGLEAQAASAPSDPRIASIDQALQILKEYEFTFPEILKVFRIQPDVVKEVVSLRAALQTAAITCGNKDVVDRCGCVIEIKESLDEKLGKDNIVAHVAWLNSGSPHLLRGTQKNEMMAGTFTDLYWSTLKFRTGTAWRYPRS